MADDEGSSPEAEPPFRGAPLPPDDRLWRHPSELRAAPQAPRPGRGPVALALAAVVGATAALVGAWALGTFGDRVVERQVIERVATPAARTVLTTTGTRSLGEALPGLRSSLVAIRAGDTVGTGVILRDDGHVLTTASLVGDRDTVPVSPADGPGLEGEVVGTDPATDLAVLSVPGLGPAGAVLAPRATPVVGDGAAVVSLSASGRAEAAQGIIAGLGITVTREDGFPLHGLISTDIVVPGQLDGAALIDQRGAVLGVATDAGGHAGVRAVPIDLALVVVDDIIETGGPAHPWLGVEGRDLSAEAATAWGLAGGAHLAEVVEGSPAAVAGLRDDDVVTQVDDVDIQSMGELITALRHLDPGDAVRIGYRRDGEARWCAAVLADPA